MPTVQIEKRQRGVFGWTFTILFWIFNALMAIWLVSYWGLLGQMSAEDEVASVGAILGGTIGTGMLLGLWFCGAAILGLMMFFTRGQKVITTKEVPDERPTHRPVGPVERYVVSAVAILAVALLVAAALIS